MFVGATVLADLGYFLGLKKRVFVPVTSIVYLGMLVDSVAQYQRTRGRNLLS